MVDCIVPATGPKELALAASLGIDDAAPVTHENFRQWVIEDDFCAGRPDWDRAGATFSDEVHAFEAMKLRILNGGHQILADIGEVMGLETISEAMTHPKINALFRRIQRDEIAPHVAPVPGFTPQSYIELIERRFANPSIVDTTRAWPLTDRPGIPDLSCPRCVTGWPRMARSRGLPLSRPPGRVIVKAHARTAAKSRPMTRCGMTCPHRRKRPKTAPPPGLR